MLGNARIAALSLDELIERRNLYMREFWYGFRLWYPFEWLPVYGSKTYFSLYRLEEIARIACVYEARIALFEE